MNIVHFVLLFILPKLAQFYKDSWPVEKYMVWLLWWTAER